MGLDDQQLKILADLKRKRGVVKASLTRVRTFVSKFIPGEQPISLLEFRQEELPQINRKFDDIQSEIELFAVDDIEGAESERGNFEEEYFAIRSQIQEIINFEKAPSTTGQNVSFGANSLLNRTQLAPIPLPKFNGNIQNWSSFFDIFQAMVHNDGSYSDAQKFFYLRSCLEGPALDLVRSIPVSDGNYEVIIQRLKERYDNRSLVIQSHIRSILDCPRIEDSSPSQALQKLYSCVCTHVAALKALDQPVEYWDAWLVTIIVSRLDKNTASSWQLHQRNTELPKYKDLEAFWANRCVAMETADSRAYGTEEINNGNSSKRTNSKKSGTYGNVKGSLIAAESRSANQCFCCTEIHRLHTCNKFKELSVKERLNVVREFRLCFNCLAPFHSADNCRSKFACQKCKQKHNTLLHFEKAAGSAVTNVPLKSNDNTASISKEGSVNNLALSAQGGEGHVFLATASILVKDRHGHFRKCRAILDSGSQINFVSNKFASQLQLPRKKVLLPVSGIGSNRVQSISSISLKLKSRITSYEVDLVCHVLPIIMDDLPRCSKPAYGWNIPDEFISQLADPEFNAAGSVDLLIGGGIFFELLESTRIQLQTGTLCLQDTKFGWIVTGEVSTGSCSLSVSCVGQVYEEDFRALCMHDSDMFGSTSKSNNKCIEEQNAQKHFKETAKRDETGRFVLRLPLKAEVYELGATLDMATSRFLSVERRLQRDEELRLQYTQFMDEYLKMGHMEKVHKEKDQPIKCIFYLPHHPVLKLSSLTTKLRVVFDASAKSSSKLSLNDVLMCGPTVQDDLFAILMRFRKHQFVITADIEKMFRQIMVDPEDRDLQRIVWRSRPDQVLESYRLTTVTYGTTSASFMATNCLIALSEETKESHPEVSKIIRRDFYMDDLMTGANTVNECCEIQQQLHTILESAKLPLRKWCSNSSEVLKYIGKSDSDPLFTLQIGVDDIIKSLGLSWKPELDEFRFIVEYNSTKFKATKRMFLSDLNRIFDPLGFLAPVLVRGKIFLQQLWQLKFEWDKPLPEDLKRRWQHFYQELKHLSSLSIPRKCIPRMSLEVEIHGFCDASEEAFGAAIYVRSKDEMGNWNSRLLCAKTRVAPLKGSTIPRLELCGALTLAHLAKKTAEA